MQAKQKQALKEEHYNTTTTYSAGK